VAACGAEKVYRIAVAHPSRPVSELSENGGLPYFRAFFEELRRLGYVEGRNLTVARYSGGGRTEQYADLAREVVRTSPDVNRDGLVTHGLTFQAASSTIPIVANTTDPVALGIAASLARLSRFFGARCNNVASDLR
jgi:hypothetical protein